ncbi:hypothetical protein K3495_g10853 [Podosphaera aphanis]|nr:hypothetical protein K3495_g10853 [Podosphaera aphanis]
MSPAARKHWKHRISRVNNKKSEKKSVPRPEPEPEEILEVTANQSMVTHVTKNENITLESKFTYKSFRVETKIEIEQDNKTKHVLLHIDHTHVDQAADLNLISSSLVGKLKLRRMELPKPIQFGTAEGRMTKATHYVKLKIAVARIWREAEALILPPTAGNPTSLILGLPWLHDVCGRLDIPTFTLRIGDSSLGEKRIEIQKTKYKLGENNRVRLVLEDQRLLELARAHVKAKIDQDLGQESTQRLKANFESTSDSSRHRHRRDGKASSNQTTPPKGALPKILNNSQLKEQSEKQETCHLSPNINHYTIKNNNAVNNNKIALKSNLLANEESLELNALKREEYVDCQKYPDLSDAASPTLRRPVIRSLSNENRKVVKDWFLQCGAKLGPMCPSKEDKFQVARLFYTSKDLSGTELSEIPVMDLYVHKITLIKDTVPYSAKRKKRWPRDKE